MTSSDHPRDDDDPRSIAQLRAKVAELSEALAARDGFLATAAHELRNPMTPILAQVQRLRRRLPSSDVGEIDGALLRIETLVESFVRRATTLLDVSRLTTGGVVLDPVPLDVGAIVATLVAAFEPAAHHVGSTIALTGAPALAARLDRVALEQILDNLLSNAVKYGAGGPVTIDVTGDAATIRITVADEGVGISPGDQARIFDRFERATGRGSGIGGFGVGLWVTSRLVAAMDGSITVASVPGEGSRFAVALPRRLGEEAP